MATEKLEDHIDYTPPMKPFLIGDFVCDNCNTNGHSFVCYYDERTLCGKCLRKAKILQALKEKHGLV